MQLMSLQRRRECYIITQLMSLQRRRERYIITQLMSLQRRRERYIITQLMSLQRRRERYIITQLMSLQRRRERYIITQFMFLQRRRERYIVIYVWKILHNVTPNDVGMTLRNSTGNGPVAVVPSLTIGSSQRNKSLYDSSFAVLGPPASVVE